LTKLHAEISEKMSFNEIRYSQVWEDEAILRESLEIRPTDVVLSITSGGCNAFSLLLMEPKRLICLDISPAQNALFSLKMAGIQHCSYQDFLVLMGAADGPRHDIYLVSVRKYRPQTP
jgi:S-adenosylmethionine-diacylglycerol 3-amino-3-carboxypropyl transferase